MSHSPDTWTFQPVESVLNMANSRYVFTFRLQPNVPDPSLYFTDSLGKAPPRPAGEPLETKFKG